MDEHSYFENQDRQLTFYVQKIKLIAVKEDPAGESIYIESPETVYGLDFLQHELLLSDREIFICLHLNIKNSLLTWEVVSVGSLNFSVVHPREVYKGAILSNAASIIFCHNHPSGDLEPSPEDIAVTKRLQDAGKLLGIQVLDHIIFGEESFVSLKERGIL